MEHIKKAAAAMPFSNLGLKRKIQVHCAFLLFDFAMLLELGPPEVRREPGYLLKITF